MRLFASTSLLLGITACSNNSQGTDSGNLEDSSAYRESICSEASTLCLSLRIPEDYAGTPRSLFVGLVDSLPPAGPPNIYLLDEENPEFEAGDALFFSMTDDVPNNGEYYIYSVLYDINGGEWVPMIGVDYVATSKSNYPFDGQGLDVGEISFALYTGE